MRVLVLLLVTLAGLAAPVAARAQVAPGSGSHRSPGPAGLGWAVGSGVGSGVAPAADPEAPGSVEDVLDGVGSAVVAGVDDGAVLLSAVVAAVVSVVAVLGALEAVGSDAVPGAEAALPPGDWELRRELASVLLTSGMESSPVSSRKSADTKRDLVRAHKWFAEAINHNNRDVEALWGYGTAATLLGKDLDLAGQALVAAYKLAPSNSEISVSLANLKSNQQKPDEMIPYLEDTIRYATDLGTRRWAAETLVEVRAFIVQRDKELEENRKQREESEKMLAEYEKMYGKSKKK